LEEKQLNKLLQYKVNIHNAKVWLPAHHTSWVRR
jgi:hypothetical protein